MPFWWNVIASVVVAGVIFLVCAFVLGIIISAARKPLRFVRFLISACVFVLFACVCYAFLSKGGLMASDTRHNNSQSARVTKSGPQAPGFSHGVRTV
jgi:hypothetical protein